MLLNLMSLSVLFVCLTSLSMCRNGALGLAREWKLKDCIAVHKLLDTVLLDSEAASSKH